MPQPPSEQSIDITLTPTAACMVAYIFGFVGSFLILLVEKQNQFVRFHAMQAFIMSLAYLGFYILFNSILGAIIFGLAYGLWGYYNLVITLVSVGYVVYTIYLINTATKGRRTKLPFIGDIAENKAASFLL